MGYGVWVMGYVKGAYGQCALFEMCFLLHFTCTTSFENIFSCVVAVDTNNLQRCHTHNVVSPNLNLHGKRNVCIKHIRSTLAIVESASYSICRNWNLSLKKMFFISDLDVILCLMNAILCLVKPSLWSHELPGWPLMWVSFHVLPIVCDKDNLVTRITACNFNVLHIV